VDQRINNSSLVHDDNKKVKGGAYMSSKPGLSKEKKVELAKAIAKSNKSLGIGCKKS
jgi:hypothetical protein